MDPFTILGVIGSVASIISLFKEENRPVTTQQVTQLIIQSSVREVPEGGALRRESILDKTSEDQLTSLVDALISMESIHEQYFRRIVRCQSVYFEAIDSADLNSEIEDAYQIARRCICRALAMIRTHNDGVLPAKYRDLYHTFNCFDLR